MRIVSLTVRSFKGLDHVELADFAPDLNLIVGPNESGKSRLAMALRYALFEKYKGESEDKKALRSYGSTDPPYVEVRFETRGTTWTVRKQFLKQAYAKLEGGGRTWTDEDAEAILRDLLGTKAIQGRRDVDQFLGLWPLLWVRQGEAWMAPQTHMNDDARARLRDVLAGHVDEVAAGPLGERIVARAERERERYFTAATGKETGELAAARARCEEARAAVAQATAKRAEAHGAADELATIEGDLLGIDARIATQRARAHEAAARATHSKEIAARLRAHEGEAARRHAESELAQGALAQRDEVGDALARDARRIEDETTTLRSMRSAHADLVTREAEATARAEAANAALEASHGEQLRARRSVHLEEATRRERDAEARLARAKGHEARVVELRAQLAESRIDEAQIRALRRAHESLTKASAALAAASASLRLKTARDLVVDGERIAEGGERAWTCDAPTRIVIDGVGVLEVKPGGADLDARRVKEQEARHAMARELEQLGVKSIAEAEERFARRTGLAAQLAQAEPLVAEAAPDGVAALEDDARARAMDRAALGEADTNAPSIADTDAGLASATAAAARTRAERDALRTEIVAGAERTSRAESNLATLARDHASANARLESLPSRDALTEALAVARAKWLDARVLVDALLEEHASAREADADLALDQERRVLERLEGERSTKHAHCVHLEATVRIHGAEDLHERAQRAEAELEERATTLRSIETRAFAARELTAALHAARREVQQRLVAPVVERARPYLEALLPGRRLRMDENWGVVGLGSGDVEEDFSDLSGGAREQVSILVRIALAEVLGAHESLPIVLDDCLVNTDRERLGEMMRILYRASRKQQILLFSCHDDGFERLGETRRYELTRGSPEGARAPR
jgi:energy-coupling factor transporter ATP-binding protein EcfA2